MDKILFSGAIITGDGLGKELGFPTLNIDPKSTNIPKDIQGVFIVQARFFSKVYNGVLHIGPRPTLQKQEYRIEVHLFHFSDTSKNTLENIEVHILKKIRSIRKFLDTEELKVQICKDTKIAQKYFLLSPYNFR
jgi:riboflavin kinase/FMN adenylyltransferase